MSVRYMRKSCVAVLLLSTVARLGLGLQLKDAGIPSKGIGSAVGSLPPVNPIRSRTENEVPLDLLPSTVNVVTHEAQFGEDVPALRASCLGMLSGIDTSASRKNRDSPSFNAFITMIGILANHTDSDYNDYNAEYNNDKKISYSLDTLSRGAAATGSSLDWHYQASLRNCAIEKGRTIFMELVRRGFTKSIGNIHSRKMSSVPFNQLKDTENNNLLHLAVMSKSGSIVNTILTLLNPQQTVEALEEHNIHGMRPIDIATSMLAEDIADTLKNSYSVAVSSIAAKESNKELLKRLLANYPTKPSAAAKDMPIEPHMTKEIPPPALAPGSVAA